MGLQKVRGVTNVTASLNEGTARLQLAYTNAVTVEDVRRIVRKHGFRPAEASVRIAGELRRERDRLLLVTPKAEYPIVRAADAAAEWDQAAKLPPRQRVTIYGRVPNQKRIEIQLLDVVVKPVPE